jgi:hypothetical protein
MRLFRRGFSGGEALQGGAIMAAEAALHNPILRKFQDG